MAHQIAQGHSLGRHGETSPPDEFWVPVLGDVGGWVHAARLRRNMSTRRTELR